MKKLSLLLLASTSVLGSTAAFAQPTPEAPPSPTANQPSNSGLQDIIVTAQRRAQNLLSVPLSIQAFSGENLASTGIKSISELQFTTPGFSPQDGVGYTQLFIRGIGNNIFVGADPSVVTYIDDTPRIYGSMINTLADVDRVEILKGAQGGLYGRNATGGVINIITRQPSDKFVADAKVSYGSRNTLVASAYVNVPVTDKVAWSFSVTRESHSPYIRNLLTPSERYTAAMFPTTTPYGTAAQTAALFNSSFHPPSGVGNQDFWTGDTKLRLQLANNFKITFAGDYSRKHDSTGDQWTNQTPGYLQNNVQNVFFPYLAGINPGTSTGAAANGLCAAGYVCLPPGFFKAGGKWTTYATVPPSANLVDYGGSAKVELNLPGWDITSISSYRTQKQYYYNDSSGSSAPLVIPIINNRRWNFYQEVRAVSNDKGPFHFLAGATYLRNHTYGNTVINYFGIAAFTGGPTVATDDVNNWSVYGQVGYDLTDKLNLTVSGRYVHEKNVASFASPTVSSATLLSQKFLPSANLSYKLEGGGVIYARYAKGWKAGGINPVTAPSVFQGGPGSLFGPEQVDTYEIGYRAPLFDRKVQVTSALFYNNYKGLQTTTGGDSSHPDILEAIINAGSARTWGAEGSITYRPIRPVTLGVDVGYLHAKYIKFSQTSTTVGLQTFNADGQHMVYAPKLQAGFTANLDQPISDQLRLVGNLLTSHISKVKQSLTDGTPTMFQPGYWLTNVRIGVRTTDDHYGAYLYVNNLFNKYYTVYGSFTLGNEQVEGNPRIIGGELDVKF
jgi:iron complex outermembrane receptor protein